MKDFDKILKAKRELYRLLLQLSEEEITDSEVDIMYLLSKEDRILGNN